jgi:hypothetical protein
MIAVVESVNQLSYMDAKAAVSLQFTVITHTRHFAPPIRHVWCGSLTGYTSLYAQAGRQQATNKPGHLQYANSPEQILI